MSVLDRVENYLVSGGVFNPELMEHEKVRDLVVDCRDELAQQKTLLDDYKKALEIAMRALNLVDEYWDTSNLEKVVPKHKQGEMPGNMAAMSIVMSKNSFKEINQILGKEEGENEV